MTTMHSYQVKWIFVDWRLGGWVGRWMGGWGGVGGVGWVQAAGHFCGGQGTSDEENQERSAGRVALALLLSTVDTQRMLLLLLVVEMGVKCIAKYKVISQRQPPSSARLQMVASITIAWPHDGTKEP